MGRNKRGRHGKASNSSRRGQGNEGERSQNGDRRPYVLAPKENMLFEEFYKGQGLVPAEEWSQFMECLQQPLPCTFRITGFRSHAKEMLKIIKERYAVDMMNIEIDGRNIQPAKCLTWYPGELAWQLDLERKLIRQEDTLKKLHQFLVQETESGNISRQETVSMIPPLVLDVKPNSKVLDMCAAPGSKTAQLIEFLHADDENGSSSEGFVVANDSDNKRCYLMVHQIGRLLSPNFAVTNMDASNLPKLVKQDEKGEKRGVKFDRILCDVPCSGDGTLRKNVDAWQRWNPAIGHGLHNLQVRILRRGMELLAVGGKLVYSTCSFNPVEDEAVVATVLKQMNGSVELVDVSEQLPGLIRESGRHTWKVMSKQKEWFEKFDDVPERLRTQITPSSFPPDPEEAKAMKLERCFRILPHKQNTGGFFVAVMEKKMTLTQASNALTMKNEQNVETVSQSETVIPAETETLTNQPDEKSSPCVSAGKRKSEDDDDICEPVLKKVRHYGYREDPFIFLKQDDEMWKPIQEFFGISPDFPFSQLMVRCENSKKRNIYFVSPIVKDLVQQNEDKFKFINLGVKILGRSVSKGVECEFRLVQDGLHILYPYITKRIVRLLKDDIVTLLSSENPYINRMSKETADQLNAMGQGGCVFVYEPDQSGDGPSCRLLLCGWKGVVSCRSFLPKFERGHFLRLCGVELQEKAERKMKAAESGVTDGDSGDITGQADEEEDEERKDHLNLDDKDVETRSDLEEEVDGKEDNMLETEVTAEPESTKELNDEPLCNDTDEKLNCAVSKD